MKMAGIDQQKNSKETNENHETRGDCEHEYHDDEDDDTAKSTQTDYKKLLFIIEELIDTEKQYVKDLQELIEKYLEPINSAGLVSKDVVNELFGNIEEIAQLQREFSDALQEPMKLLTKVSKSNESQIFKKVMFSIGSAFLFFADNFVVYSSFCASHTRSRRVFSSNQNQALKEFLTEQQRKNTYSTSLESYLIKPIQRITKYPLLLSDMCKVVDSESDEHYHLSQALKEIGRVNRQVNKLQEIYEGYGTMLDETSKTYNRNGDASQPFVDLSIGELKHHGHVTWCNVGSVGQMHKDLNLQTTVFVFRTGIVFYCRGTIQQQQTSRVLSIKRKQTIQSEQVDIFQKVIPIREAKVEDGELEDSGQLNWWNLIHVNKDKKDGSSFSTYKLCSSSAEDKATFFTQIQQLSKRLSTDYGRKTSYVALGGKRLETLPSSKRSARRGLSKRRGEKT